MIERPEDINKFFSEIQMLKRVRHEGFRLTGVLEPDSLAEHSLNAAQIAYVLGWMEGVDPEKCAVICIFHDNHEIRTGDHHKVSIRYVDSKSAEREAESEQLSRLPKDLADRIMRALDEKHARSTKEGRVAQDADRLEIAMQAKVYVEQGYVGCEDWIKNVGDYLTTDSAKAVWQKMKDDPDFTNTWWRGLKKIVD